MGVVLWEPEILQIFGSGSGGKETGCYCKQNTNNARDDLQAQSELGSSPNGNGNGYLWCHQGSLTIGPPLFFVPLPFILIPFSVLDLGPVPLAAKMFHLNLKVVVPGSPSVEWTGRGGEGVDGQDKERPWTGSGERLDASDSSSASYDGNQQITSL